MVDFSNVTIGEPTWEQRAEAAESQLLQADQRLVEATRDLNRRAKRAEADLAIARGALSDIALLGADCPAAMTEAEFDRAQIRRAKTSARVALTRIRGGK